MGLLIVFGIIALIFILNAIFPSFFSMILSGIFANSTVALVVLLLAVIGVIFIVIQVFKPLFSGMNGFNKK